MSDSWCKLVDIRTGGFAGWLHTWVRVSAGPQRIRYKCRNCGKGRLHGVHREADAGGSGE